MSHRMNPAKPRLRKDLGQHHLVAPELCRPLVDWLARRRGPVVEIGPGGGVLTRQLASIGPLMAVEFDPAWGLSLAGEVAGARVVIADARHLAWQRLPPDSWVVGNLPYNLSTLLIEGVLDLAPSGVAMAFLVQLEVARRLAAAPGSSDYGSLSVIAQARTSWQLLARVRPGSFRPPPKVDSAFVGSGPLAPWPLDGPGSVSEERPATSRHETGPAGSDWRQFKSFVRAAFARRRKTLVNSLRGTTSQLPSGRVTWSRGSVEALLDRLGRDPRSRAEELAVADYLQLWQYLASAEAASELVDGELADG